MKITRIILLFTGLLISSWIYAAELQRTHSSEDIYREYSVVMANLFPEKTQEARNKANAATIKENGRWLKKQGMKIVVNPDLSPKTKKKNLS